MIRMNITSARSGLSFSHYQHQYSSDSEGAVGIAHHRVGEPLCPRFACDSSLTSRPCKGEVIS